VQEAETGSREWIGRALIVARSGQVKGNLVNSRARYVQEHWGDGELRALRERLSGDARAYVTEHFPTGNWYAYKPLVEVDAAIIAGPMRGDWTQMRQFGAEIAFYDLRSVYRALIRMSTAGFLLSHIGIAYALYFKGGKMFSPEGGAKHRIIVLEGGASPRYMCTYGFTGWFCAAAEAAGAKRVRGEHTRCQHLGDRTCDWRIEWD
jgi:hypothetical protein